MSYGHWERPLSRDQSDGIIREISRIFASRIENRDLRGQLNAAIESSNYPLLCDFPLSYTSGLSVHDVICARQVLGLYEKRGDIDLGFDRKSVALTKWKKAEAHCLQSNLAFASWKRGGFQFHPAVEAVFHSSARKISRILGEVPDLDAFKMRFGPGATTAVKRRNASARCKLGSGFQCSGNFARIAPAVLESLQAWLPEGEGPSVTIDLEINTSSIVFVPKNAKTDRSIGVEPVLNSFVQLGIGDYMSDRLRRVGIDLRDQVPNQRLAREGSITGALATLDLSSASDLISIGLVEHLLPEPWFDLLDACRSPDVTLPGGERVRLQKFSSMGNGYTFPLESLLFWVFVQSCCEATNVSSTHARVYGDDIIIPTEAVSLLKLVLRSAGFLLNDEKSFWDGPFRESCGKDYYFGIDVRPAFVKREISCEDLFRLHNHFFRLYDEELCDYLLSVIPDELKLFGPDGYGDGHLLCKDPLSVLRRKPKHVRAGFGGYVFDSLVKIPRKSKRVYPGDHVLPVYSVYLSGGMGENPAQYERGSLVVDLPGSRGIKRISIYTLDPS